MVSVNQETCTGCGLCVTVCPELVLAQPEAQPVAVRPEHCMQCGHCMAVCPEQAIVVPPLAYEQFDELPPAAWDSAGLEGFMLTRRSVRRFEKRPVEREKLERLVQVAGLAPCGMPPNCVEVAVVPTREQVAGLLPEAIKRYEIFMRMMRTWPVRWFLRRSMGAREFDGLRERLLPFFESMVRAWREDGRDCVTWGAPALLVFHADPGEVAAGHNCVIACTYAALAARAEGLGSTMIGVLPPVIERSCAMRQRLGIPPEHKVEICLIVGYPEVRFLRTIPRAVRRLQWVEQGPSPGA